MRVRREEDGAVMPLVGLLAVVLVLAAGFTADLGTLAARTRRLQGVADVVALDAAKELNGRACNASYTNPGETVPSTQYDHVAAAAVASAARNGHVLAGNKTLGVTLGKLARYAADDGAGHKAGDIMYTSDGRTTFTPISSCPTSSEVPDAVKVAAGDRVDYGFSRVVGFSGANPTRSAIGVQRPIGAFTIGSYVGTVDTTQASMMNGLLGRMLCRVGPPCDASVSVAGYNGLAATRVSLGRLQQAAGVASPSALLNASLTAGQIFTAAASAVSGSTPADTSAKAALLSLAATTTSTTTVKLGDYITVQQGGTDASGTDVTAQVGIRLFELVQATAALANGRTAVIIPSAVITTAGLPTGVSSLTASLDLVEGPLTVVGQPGASATTKQVRLTLTPVLDVAVPAGVVGPSPATITGTMPITVQGATGTGTLSATSCYTGSFRQIGTNTRVQAATSSASGTLSVNVLGVTTATIAVSGTGLSTTNGTFPDTFDYAAGYYQTVRHGNHQVGLSAINLGASTYTTVGLGGTTTALSSSLSTSIVDAIAPLDPRLVQRVSNLLGISLGSADVMAVDPLVCNAPTIAG